MVAGNPLNSPGGGHSGPTGPLSTAAAVSHNQKVSLSRSSSEHYFTLGDERKLSIHADFQKTKECLSNPFACDELSAEELIYNLFKIPHKNDASIGKLLMVLKNYGLEETDPRLRPMMEKIREIERQKEDSRGEAKDPRHWKLRREDFKLCISESLSLISQTLQNDLIVPSWGEFTRIIKQIYVKCQKEPNVGKVADYIPQLSRMSPDLWGVSLCTVDGQRYSVGDAKIPFCVQSVSKAFNYAIAASELGAEYVHQHVGQEPSGRLFNDICLDSNHKPHNPMVNSGAIIVTSLIQNKLNMADRFDHMLTQYKKISGGEYVGFNNAVFLSERSTADRNFALAYYMKENGCFPPETTSLTEALDFYFQLCSLEMTCESAAVMAATLANGGVCPITGERCIGSRPCRDVLSLMNSCGMYDYSGQFAFHVGLPAKSGVSGIMIVVVPNLLGLALYSPPLDKLGNSSRGVSFCKEMIQRFNFHNYDSLAHNESEKFDPRRRVGEREKDQIVSLLFAAKAGDLNTVRRMFMQGYDLEMADYDKRTALHLAASEGHTEVAQFLLHTAKVRADPKDRWKRTPLHDAKSQNHVGCIQLLEKALCLVEHGDEEDEEEDDPFYSEQKAYTPPRRNTSANALSSAQWARSNESLVSAVKNGPSAPLNDDNTKFATRKTEHTQFSIPKSMSTGKIEDELAQAHSRGTFETLRTSFDRPAHVNGDVGTWANQPFYNANDADVHGSIHSPSHSHNHTVVNSKTAATNDCVNNINDYEKHSHNHRTVPKDANTNTASGPIQTQNNMDVHGSIHGPSHITLPNDVNSNTATANGSVCNNNDVNGHSHSNGHGHSYILSGTPNDAKSNDHASQAEYDPPLANHTISIRGGRDYLSGENEKRLLDTNTSRTDYRANHENQTLDAELNGSRVVRPPVLANGNKYNESTKPESISIQVHQHDPAQIQHKNYSSMTINPESHSTTNSTARAKVPDADALHYNKRADNGGSNAKNTGNLRRKPTPRHDALISQTHRSNSIGNGEAARKNNTSLTQNSGYHSGKLESRNFPSTKEITQLLKDCDSGNKCYINHCVATDNMPLPNNIKDYDGSMRKDQEYDIIKRENKREAIENDENFGQNETEAKFQNKIFQTESKSEGRKNYFDQHSYENYGSPATGYYATDKRKESSINAKKIRRSRKSSARRAEHSGAKTSGDSCSSGDNSSSGEFVRRKKSSHKSEEKVNGRSRKCSKENDGHNHDTVEQMRNRSATQPTNSAVMLFKTTEKSLVILSRNSVAENVNHDDNSAAQSASQGASNRVGENAYKDVSNTESGAVNRVAADRAEAPIGFDWMGADRIDSPVEVRSVALAPENVAHLRKLSNSFTGFSRPLSYNSPPAKAELIEALKRNMARNVGHVSSSSSSDSTSSSSSSTDPESEPEESDSQNEGNHHQENNENHKGTVAKTSVEHANVDEHACGPYCQIFSRELSSDGKLQSAVDYSNNTEYNTSETRNFDNSSGNDGSNRNYSNANGNYDKNNANNAGNYGNESELAILDQSTYDRFC